MRVSHQEFGSLDLEVHSFLGDVRLHDVSALDLPGGTLIEPFRRFIVYPTILQRLRASWIEQYGTT